MPGARAAWLTCADASLISEMTKIQSCASGNASTISQVGLEAALKHCLSSPSVLQEVATFYLQRARAVADGLNGLAHKHGLAAPICTAPDATFYVWADFSSCAGVATDHDIFSHLLKLGVAVIPGSAFAMAPGRRMVRLSCALESLADVETALERIDHAMGEWVRR